MMNGSGEPLRKGGTVAGRVLERHELSGHALDDLKASGRPQVLEGPMFLSFEACPWLMARMGLRRGGCKRVWMERWAGLTAELSLSRRVGACWGGFLAPQASQAPSRCLAGASPAATVPSVQLHATFCQVRRSSEVRDKAEASGGRHWA